MSAVVNLTELAAARAKMTPGTWSTLIGSACSPDPDEACGVASSHSRVSNRGRETVFRSDAYDECSHPISRADADGIVATHNAADALIEVAHSILVIRAADAAHEEAMRLWVNAASAVSISQVDHAVRERDVAACDLAVADARDKIGEANEALEKVLAKVSL